MTSSVGCDCGIGNEIKRNSQNTLLTIFLHLKKKLLLDILPWHEPFIDHSSAFGYPGHDT